MKIYAKKILNFKAQINFIDFFVKLNLDEIPFLVLLLFVEFKWYLNLNFKYDLQRFINFIMSFKYYLNPKSRLSYYKIFTYFIA